ncbi:BBS4 [Scenedesmus sp. PABB004]|nr:BBS4 [Scenedesmus sp. PABB004]
MAAQHNHLIHQLYVRQQFDECGALIDRVLAESAGSSEYAVYVKALIARQRGRISESLRLFQQAAALNPSSVANLKQVGRSLFLLGKHRGAAEVYDEALRLDGRDWELWLSRGQCAAAAEDWDRRARALRWVRLAARAASLPTKRLAAARAPRRALECFASANAIQPHDATFLAIGAAHAERGRLDAALAAYGEGLEHSPDSPELLTTLGITFLRLGNNQRAFEHLGASMLHDPRNPRTILAAGSIIQARPRARPPGPRAARQRAAAAAAAAGAAGTPQDHGDADVALVKYRVAAAACPGSPQLWNNRYIAAIACLKRALYLGPLEWLTAHNLGLVHLATGQAASAFHYLSAAVNLRPDFAHSYSYLGIALARLDDPDNAAAAHAKAVGLAPGEPLLHLNYGEPRTILLHNRGDARAARARLDEFRRALGGADGAASAEPEMLEAAAALAAALDGAGAGGGA